jgi:hypothetical protein
MQFAKRLEKIPPYLFAEIDRKRMKWLLRELTLLTWA